MKQNKTIQHTTEHNKQRNNYKGTILAAAVAENKHFLSHKSVKMLYKL